jgi:UDP-GlcNAc:undecaprenyl-phosphate GlcNAc-1-phosphate transferase
MRRAGARFGFLDVPQPQDIHTHPIPRIGGLAMFAAFLLGLGVALVVPVERNDAQELYKLLGLVAGALIVVGFGLADDRWGLHPGIQLAGQLVGAIVAMSLGIVIQILRNPLGAASIDLAGWLGIALTLFWMVGMMNTVNWLDGLDGLAAGVATITGLILFVHTFTLGQHSMALFPLALAGAALGFLPHNFHPTDIFMGSSGAYLLGFALAALSVMGGAKLATALFVMAVPILDVAWQIADRLRRGRSPFRGTRNHLHHRLYDLGLSQRQVVFVYYALSACFGVLALVLPTPLEKLYVLIGLGIAVILTLLALSLLDGLKGRQEDSNG